MQPPTATMPRSARRNSAFKFKGYGHFHINRNGLPVEKGGLVLPLPYSVESGSHQKRISGDDFHLRDVTVLVDYRIDCHLSTNSGLLSQDRINGLDLPDKARLLDFSSDTIRAVAGYWLRWRRGNKLAVSRPQNSSQHTTQLPAGYSTRHATGHAGKGEL